MGEDSTVRDEEPSGLRAVTATSGGKTVGAVCLLLGLLLLAGLSIGLLLGAASENSRAQRFSTQGIAADARVESCLGQLGGSGTNAAGYACTVSYSVDGVAHRAIIGGLTTFVPTGKHLSAVVDPQDSGVIFTTGAARAMHASSSRYVVPVLLLVLTAGLGTVSIRWWRRRPR